MMLQRLCLVAVGVLGLTGCTGDSGADNRATNEVVVYTALDQQFSEPILQEFTKQTGIVVHAQYDTESTKTIGLVNRIRAEKDRPRCDVFWNNEILNTLRLKNEGLLQPCQPAEAENYPPQYRDSAGMWFGFAARARVLAVCAEDVPPDKMPTSIKDLADRQWHGRIGIAKPLFGTTASHIACLFAKLGDSGARELLDSFKANGIVIAGGNHACAQMAAGGELAFGLTDTDDALVEKDAGKSVVIVFPDAGPDQMGTLLLPNTLALVKGCPHPEAGQKLINYLLSAEVEDRLAAGPSGQIPLNKNATVTSRVGNLKDIHPMQVDFEKAAELFPVAAKYIEEHFLAP